MNSGRRDSIVGSWSQVVASATRLSDDEIAGVNALLTEPAVELKGMKRISVEICVGDIGSSITAAAGGADRIELCANLAAGGTTPSAGTIAESCQRLTIPVHVLIRPREGDFAYSEAELAVMRHDIAVAKTCGAAGVVLGVLTRAAVVDREKTAALVALARPMRVTFHKAFDQTRDLKEALDTLISLGVDRVLTSGGRPTALAGLDVLAGLVERAPRTIIIMAGGRLSLQNLETVIRGSGVAEVHLGSGVNRSMGDEANQSTDDSLEGCSHITDQHKVAAIVELVKSL
jgi:copper homeostasis protein